MPDGGGERCKALKHGSLHQGKVDAHLLNSATLQHCQSSSIATACTVKQVILRNAIDQHPEFLGTQLYAVRTYFFATCVSISFREVLKLTIPAYACQYFKAQCGTLQLLVLAQHLSAV